MLLRALFRRLAVPAVAAGLAATGLALPAQADPEPEFEVPYVAIMSPETVSVISGQSKTVKFELYNFTTVTAEDVVLRFGTTANPITAGLGLELPSGCAATACDLGDLKPLEQRTVKFTVTPTGDAPAHRLGLSTSVAGEESDETLVAVVRTNKAGADLEMSDIADLKVAQGKSADVPFEVRNTGNAPVKALGLVVFPAIGGVDPVLNYRNCLTEAETEAGEVVCVFNEPVAAGSTFTLPKDSPLRVKVRSDAAGPFEYPLLVAAVGLTDAFVIDATKKIRARSGPELKLESLVSSSADEPTAAPDLNPDDNAGDFTVTVPTSSADSSAIGGVVTGAVGDTKEIEFGYRNLGPTSTVPPTAGFMPYVHVKLPTGIALSRIADNCLPGTTPEKVDLDNLDSLDGRDYVCIAAKQNLAKGEKALFTFTGEITGGAHQAGSVTVEGGVQDRRSGNDTAALTVKIVDTSGAGGDEGDGGEGGGLPVTGAPAGLLAGGGAVLLVAGLIAYRMTRRRRIVTVVE